MKDNILLMIFGYTLLLGPFIWGLWRVMSVESKLKRVINKLKQTR